MNNAANRHQHATVIASLKEKLQRLGSRDDEAGRFARAQFKAWIKRAQERLAAFNEAEVAYAKQYGELCDAQVVYDQKRAELLAAVEAELAPLARRVDTATRACGHEPRLDPFPWNYSGGSTEELAHKALHDPNGNHGASLCEFIGYRRTQSPGDMALAILEEANYAPDSAVWDSAVWAGKGGFSQVQKAFETRWTVWSSANHAAIAAVGA